MKKIKWKKVAIFLMIYVLCFLYSFFVSTVFNDEIWNYGFSYNIASGLIPYRDFGMLQTPFYFFCASIFIKIFGGYLYSFHLFNSIILACIIYFLYNRLRLKSFILIPFIFLNCYSGYNIFSVFLVLIIVDLVDKEFSYKDYVLGLLVGIMFLTKQNIGICLWIPMMYYSKNRLKGFIGFITPIIFFLIYLLVYNAFYAFIDYAILGMFDFGESNSIWLFFPVEAVICLLILFQLFRSKFQNQKLFYILMYQIVTVPIFDDYHFMIGFILVLYYVLLVKNIEKYKIKYYVMISLFFCFCWDYQIHKFDGIHFYDDKNSYLYGRNIPNYVQFNEITKYIQEKKDVYDHIYMFSKNAFYVKLNAKYPLDKFDMICNGNMGYRGSFRYIEEVENYCEDNTCLFILYKYEFEAGMNQTNQSIIDFVKDTYNFKEDLDWFDIYVN